MVQRLMAYYLMSQKGQKTVRHMQVQLRICCPTGEEKQVNILSQITKTKTNGALKTGYPVWTNQQAGVLRARRIKTYQDILIMICTRMIACNAVNCKSGFGLDS